MNDTSYVDRLLADLHDDLEAEGFLALYEFSWTVRGYQLGLDENEVKTICEDAYCRLRDQQSFRTMLSGWPIDLDAATPAPADLEPDFDIGTTGQARLPIQLIVPV